MFVPKELMLKEFIKMTSANDTQSTHLFESTEHTDEEVNDLFYKAISTENTCIVWNLTFISLSFALCIVFIACAGCHKNRNGVSTDKATQYGFIIATFGVVFYLIHLFDYLSYYFRWIYWYHGWMYWLLWFARASTLWYYWIYNGRYF